MKAKLEYCLRWLREGAVRVVRSYPVETLLALYACIRCLLTYELDWSEEELFNRLGLVPLFFASALRIEVVSAPFIVGPAASRPIVAPSAPSCTMTR